MDTPSRPEFVELVGGGIPATVKASIVIQRFRLGRRVQGGANYGLVARGATGASAVRRHSIIDEKNHGKNVSGPLGGQFQARLNGSVASGHEVFPGTCNCILYME